MKKIIIIFVMFFGPNMNSQYNIKTMNDFHIKIGMLFFENFLEKQEDPANYIRNYQHVDNLGVVKFFKKGSSENLFSYENEKDTIYISYTSTKKEMQRFLYKLNPILRREITKKEIHKMYEPFYDKEAYSFLKKRYKNIHKLVGESMFLGKKSGYYSSNNDFLYKDLVFSFCREGVSEFTIGDHQFAKTGFSIYPLLDYLSPQNGGIHLWENETFDNVSVDLFGFFTQKRNKNKWERVPIEKKKFISMWNKKRYKKLKKLID